MIGSTVFSGKFRRVAAAFSLLLCALSVELPALRAQPTVPTYQVIVLDASTRKPVPDAVCNVLDTSGIKILHFAVTDHEGKAEMKRPATAGDLVVSVLGYESKRQAMRLLSASSVNQIFLKPSAVDIKEVHVHAAPIKKYGDTIVYNVPAFVDSKDRHLVDVLKKLPGITVTSSGMIKYQGESISKLYIEGQDLLGGRYNQATRNLPVEAVSQVHLMERHQDKKVLQDKVPSERAALNIKLKRGYMIRPFGELFLGIGGEPLLWDARIFLMQVSQANQLMITGKSNDRGLDLEGETMEHSDFSDIMTYIPSMMRIFLPISVNAPPLSRRRYLQNRAFSWGVNDLVRINDNSNLRFNLLGYIDRKRASQHAESLFGGAFPLQIDERENTESRLQTYVPIVKYELNSRAVFLSDEIRGSYSSGKHERLLWTSEHGMTQRVTSQPAFVQNKFRATFPVGDFTFSLNSDIRYDNLQERLFIKSHDDQIFSQAFVSERFATKNRMTTGFYISKLYTELAAFVHYDQRRFNSDEIAGFSMIRDLTVGLSPNFSLRFSEVLFSLSLPLEWSFIQLRGESGHLDDKKVFRVAPDFTMNYRINSNWRTRATVSYSPENVSPAIFSDSVFRRDYRTKFLSQREIFLNRAVRSSFYLHYGDILSMINTSLKVTHAYEWLNVYHDYEYLEDFTIVSVRPGKSQAQNLYASLEFDKTFIDLGLMFRSSFHYQFAERLISQSAVRFRNRSHVFSLPISLEFNKIQWMTLEYDFTGNCFFHLNSIKRSPCLTSWSNLLRASFFIGEGVSIDARFENSINEVRVAHFQYANFLDLALKYLIDKRFELGVSVSNLLNNRSYEETSIDGINRFSNYYALRPREFLIHFSMRF